MVASPWGLWNKDAHPSSSDGRTRQWCIPERQDKQSISESLLKIVVKMLLYKPRSPLMWYQQSALSCLPICVLCDQHMPKKMSLQFRRQVSIPLTCYQKKPKTLKWKMASVSVSQLHSSIIFLFWLIRLAYSSSLMEFDMFLVTLQWKCVNGIVNLTEKKVKHYTTPLTSVHS